MSMLYQHPQSFAPSYPVHAGAGDDDEDTTVHGKKVATQVSGGNYNIHKVLVTNITRSDYYRYDLINVKDHEVLLSHIKEHVQDLEPTMVGRPNHPSSAFCILYRLCELGIYEKQMKAMIHRKQRAMVRGMGFLYLRYLSPPSQLWNWFSPFLTDPQNISWGGGMHKEVITIGKFLQRILMDHRYFSTHFPRIPVPIEKEFKVKLMEFEVLQIRAAENEKIRPELREGLRVTAEYSEDKEWYEAVIDRLLQNGHILLTFTEYGNQEEVDIGCIKLRGRPSHSPKRSRSRSRRGSSRDRRYRDGRDRRRRHSRSRSRSHSRDRRRRRRRSREDYGPRRSRRSRSRSPDRSRRRRSRSRSGRGGMDRDELLRIVEERERAKAVVSSGRSYSKPVKSIKSAISAGGRTSDSHLRRSSSPRRRHRQRKSSADEPATESAPSKELSAEQKVRRFKLMAKYGDASAN